MRGLLVTIAFLLVGCETGEHASPPAGANGDDHAASPAPQRPSAEGSEVKQAAESLHGYWKVTRATANGEPWREGVGQIHVFKQDGKVWTVGHDFESNEEYRCDARQDPPTLVTYFFNPDLAGSGICELRGDTLRWRISDDEQPLSFSDDPRGSWNEYEMTRITPEQAEPLIAALQDERLQIEAAAP